MDIGKYLVAAVLGFMSSGLFVIPVSLVYPWAKKKNANNNLWAIFWVVLTGVCFICPMLAFGWLFQEGVLSEYAREHRKTTIYSYLFFCAVFAIRWMKKDVIPTYYDK